jgi:chitinase
MSPTPAPANYSSTAIYTKGMTVEENGVLYVANWWTQGNDPAHNNGVFGTGEPWTIVASASGTPVPSTPTQLAITLTTSSAVTLTWSASTVAGGGTVTSYAIDENGIQIGSVAGTATTYTATNLAASTSYNFTVTAIDSSGSSAPSIAVAATTTSPGVQTAPAWNSTAVYTAGMTVSENGVIYTANWWTQGNDPGSNSGVKGSGEPWTAIATVSPVKAAPNAPTNLSAAAAPTSVNLSWTAASVPGSGTVTGYAVFENGSEIGTVTGTSYTATGLRASTAYTFAVSAFDSAGSSPQTNPLSVTTAAGLVPTAPTDLTSSNLTSSSVVLSWSAPPAPAGATLSSYTVLNDGVAVGSTTSTGFTVTGLSASTAYSLTVEASDQYGASAPSSALAVTTPANAPPPPSNVPAWSPTAVYTAGMTASENGIIYSANWWTQGNDPSTNNGVKGTGEPWTATGKLNTTPTAPNAPTGLTATAVSSSVIDLNWAAATVPGSGTVSDYAIFENGTQIATTTNTYYNVGSLAASTAYQFTVDAVDATGTSPQSSTASATTLAPGTSTSHAVFAPYIDMGFSPNLAAIAQTSGVDQFTLAFIQSSGPGTIGWSGTGTISSDTLSNGSTIQSDVSALQAIGGNVTISFGGAAGTDPAVAAAAAGASAASLQAEYQSVINRYNVNSLDFDIEGAAEGNQASLKLRDAALVGLEKANPGLQISYTVPVLPTGLDFNGLNIIQTAAKDGVDISVVNIMTMDYGSAVDNGGAMGTDAIDAIQATEKQLTSIGLHAKIGVTPLIGVNDVTSEVFTLADAQQLVAYVATDPDVARISMWSVGRDNGSTAGQNYDSPTGSGIAQTPYEFSKIFNTASASAQTAQLTQAMASFASSQSVTTAPTPTSVSNSSAAIIAANQVTH